MKPDGPVVSGQNLKAVTHKDAEANFADWDARVGDHFWTRHNEAKEGDVPLDPKEFWATGSYDLDAISKPLEAIRSAVARFTARKVTRSFCKNHLCSM
jgi:hypothetical protein